MVAILTDAPFDDPAWVFESKWDGFRMMASIENGRVTLYSRNGKIISETYRQVAQALASVKADAVLDGELVALDEHGISRFQLLQNALRAQAALRYYLFDLTFLDGRDLRRLPLLARKEELRRILPNHPRLAFSAHRPEWGTKYFTSAEEHGLEGIMAKRAASPYLSGCEAATG
jgi:bifunctional non-homologous end joining protein LigD